MRWMLGQTGLSLVEIMVASTILGGAGLVVMNSTDLLTKGKKSTESKGQMAELHGQAMVGLKKVLFDTKQSNGRYQDGVCKLVRPDPTARPPVGPINVNLSQFSSIFTAQRWDEFLPSWKQVNKSACSSPQLGQYCFDLNPNDESIQVEIKKLKPELYVLVTPINLNPKEGELFRPITNANLSRDIDVKSVGFNFLVKLSYEETGGQRKSQELETFEWLGLAGFCDFKMPDGTDYKLSFSGMELLQGNNVIINRAGFDGNKEKPVDIKFRSIVAQAGIYRPNGQYIFTDRSKNVVTSCKEIEYRCPQLGSNKRKYEDLTVVADLNYRVSNYVASASSMRSRIDYKIKKNETEIGIPVDRYFGLGVDCSAKGPQGEVNASCTKVDHFQTTLSDTHMLSVTMFDKNKAWRTDQLCQEICHDSSNYNSSGTNSSDRYTGYLTFNYYDYGKKQEEVVADRISCTACYMKNCDQFGLGTFGPMHLMPYQPLDSVIPECSIHEPDTVLYDQLSLLGQSFEGAPWPKNLPQCISARLNSSSDGLIYSVESCANKLPVMCYGFGQFLLARDLANSSSALASVNYSEAAGRCFQIGKEVTRKDKLDEFMGGAVPLSVVNGNYEFFNLATQGTFLAPQTRKDLNSYNAWRERNGISQNTRFWVAQVRDGANFVAPRPPIISKFVDDQKHALYYDGNKKLAYGEFGFSFNGHPSTGPFAGILFHNIKYKGLKMASPQNPFGDGRKLRFICRKKEFPFALFLSQRDSQNISDGDNACHAEKGLFLPPLTSYEWVRAFTLVEANSAFHAFPTPNYPSGLLSVGAAWVAVTTQKLDEGGDEWQTYPSNDLKEDFQSTEKYTPRTQDPVVVLDGEGKYRSPRAFLDGGGVHPVSIKPKQVFKIKINGKDYDIEYNSEGTAEKQYSPEEIVEVFNKEVGHVAKMILIKEKDNKLRTRIETNIIGKEGELEILTSELASEFGYSDKDFSQGPKLQELCLNEQKRLSEIRYKEERCLGQKVSFSDMDGSEVFKTLWGLYQFPEQGRYAFQR